MITNYEVDFEKEVDVIDDEEITNNLVVFNDNVNTFDHVIQTLVEVCKHTLEQAEQCAWIIHFKGKCNVKSGSFEELIPLKRKINDRLINAEII